MKAKIEKFFLDGEGNLHGPTCPKTEEAWGSFEDRGQDTTCDGPAQVATPAYREGYDRIFGTKPAVGQA
jgi:hypothetical protein